MIDLDDLTLFLGQTLSVIVACTRLWKKFISQLLRHETRRIPVNGLGLVPRPNLRRPKNRGLAPLTEKFNPATLWIWRRCPDYDDDQTIKRRLSSARDSVDRFEAAFGCDHPVEQTFPLVRTSDQAAEQTFPLVGTFELAATPIFPLVGTVELAAAPIFPLVGTF